MLPAHSNGPCLHVTVVVVVVVVVPIKANPPCALVISPDEEIEVDVVILRSIDPMYESNGSTGGRFSVWTRDCMFK